MYQANRPKRKKNYMYIDRSVLKLNMLPNYATDFVCCALFSNNNDFEIGPIERSMDGNGFDDSFRDCSMEL